MSGTGIGMGLELRPQLEIRPALLMHNIVVCENQQAADSLFSEDISDRLIDFPVRNELFARPLLIADDDWVYDKRITDRLDREKSRIVDAVNDPETVCYAVGMPISWRYLKKSAEAREDLGLSRARANIPLMQIPVIGGSIREDYFFGEPYEGIVFDNDMSLSLARSMRKYVNRFFKEISPRFPLDLNLDNEEVKTESVVDITMIIKKMTKDFDRGGCKLFLMLNAHDESKLGRVRAELEGRFLALPNRKMDFQAVSYDDISNRPIMKNELYNDFQTEAHEINRMNRANWQEEEQFEN